ncbi:MAG: hypothetical protein H6742_19105 [Alphaproteobacteria bacterium]|nr:hypothetical protein [Alphaproteobacteria bacterium]
MNEDRQAQLLAEWLRQEPGTEPPQQLDRDAIEAVYALRPDLAPAPGLSIDDILDEVAEGPLARPAAPRDAEEAAAVAALVAWLEERPGVRPPADSDPVVVEAVYALRPDLAPAPDIDLDELFASVRTGPFAGSAQDGAAGGAADGGAGPGASGLLTESEGLPPGVVADPDTVVDLAAAANQRPARRRGLPAWAIPGLGAVAVAATALLFVVPGAREAMDAPTPFSAAETLDAKREAAATETTTKGPAAQTATPAAAADPAPAERKNALEKEVQRAGEAVEEAEEDAWDGAEGELGGGRAQRQKSAELEDLGAVGYLDDVAGGTAGLGNVGSAGLTTGSTSAGRRAMDESIVETAVAQPKAETRASGAAPPAPPVTASPGRSYSPPTEADAPARDAAFAEPPTGTAVAGGGAAASGATASGDAWGPADEAGYDARYDSRNEVDELDASAVATRTEAADLESAEAESSRRRPTPPRLSPAKESDRKPLSGGGKKKDLAPASAPAAEPAGSRWSADADLAEEQAPALDDADPTYGTGSASTAQGGDGLDLAGLRSAANPVGALPDVTLGRPDVAAVHQAARDADGRGDDAGYIAALRPLLGHGTVAVAQDAAWRIARRQTSLGQLSAARSTIATGLGRGTTGPWASRLYALQGELAERQGEAAGAAEAYRRAIQAR